MCILDCVYVGACLFHVVFKSNVALVDNASAVGWQTALHRCFQIDVRGFPEVHVQVIVFEVLKQTKKFIEIFKTS